MRLVHAKRVATWTHMCYPIENALLLEPDQPINAIETLRTCGSYCWNLPMNQMNPITNPDCFIEAVIGLLFTIILQKTSFGYITVKSIYWHYFIKYFNIFNSPKILENTLC